jgi:hypothetical protein
MAAGFFSLQDPQSLVAAVLSGSNGLASLSVGSLTGNVTIGTSTTAIFAPSIVIPPQGVQYLVLILVQVVWSASGAASVEWIVNINGNATEVDQQAGAAGTFSAFCFNGVILSPNQSFSAAINGVASVASTITVKETGVQGDNATRFAAFVLPAS